MNLWLVMSLFSLFSLFLKINFFWVFEIMKSKRKSVADLKTLFENLDRTLHIVPTDLGSGHYQRAKKRTLTLSLKKRERNYADLRSIFTKEEEWAEGPTVLDDVSRTRGAELILR